MTESGKILSLKNLVWIDKLIELESAAWQAMLLSESRLRDSS